MKLQRCVVSDHRVRGEPTRQEKQVELEVLRGNATGHDGVQPTPDMQQMPCAEMLLEDRLARGELERAAFSMHRREVFESEHGVCREVVDGLHVLAVRSLKDNKT